MRLTDSRERRRLTGHLSGVTALEFSPDGRLIASTGKDGSVRFWDAASGALRQTVARPNAIGQTVGFSPDGRRLVAVGLGGLRVWELVPLVEPANPVPWKARLLINEEGNFRDLLFHPEGRWIAFVGNINRGSWDGQILIRSFDPRIVDGATSNSTSRTGPTMPWAGPSAATKCWRRSARAAVGSCMWPNKPSRCAAALR